jgi:hypothetical protein
MKKGRAIRRKEDFLHIFFFFFFFCFCNILQYLSSSFFFYNFISFSVYFYVGGCKYIDRSQYDYFTKGLWISFSPFSPLHMKEFFNEIFCNLLLKIHIVAPIDHMFCVNHCWRNMNFSKCINFATFFISSWRFIIIWDHNKVC